MITDADKFWEGVSTYYRFAANLLDANGYGFTYIYPMENNTYMLTTDSYFINFTQEAVFTAMQPLYDELQRIGINVTNPTSLFTSPYGTPGIGISGPPTNTRYRSRLLPRANWEDDGLWNQTMSAIRTATEAGFANNFYFHATLTSPTVEAAGWPGNESAVNPAWRKNGMHAMLMDQTAQQSVERDGMFEQYSSLLRDVSPGAGSYMNEGDPGEPNWQQAFYGDHYERLSSIKQTLDPWGLLWAPTTPGSERWAVNSVSSYSGTQNGRLCRVEAA